MSMFAVTDADRCRWQNHAAQALTSLVKRGFEEGLPPIDWTVRGCLTLLGRCTQSAMPDRRAAWQAWTAALSAVPMSVPPPVYGTVHLRSVAQRVRGSVSVTLLADVYPDDPDEPTIPGACDAPQPGQPTLVGGR